jgi:hypothetical protein
MIGGGGDDQRPLASDRTLLQDSLMRSNQGNIRFFSLILKS